MVIEQSIIQVTVQASYIFSEQSIYVFFWYWSLLFMPVGTYDGENVNFSIGGFIISNKVSFLDHIELCHNIFPV